MNIVENRMSFFSDDELRLILIGLDVGRFEGQIKEDDIDFIRLTFEIENEERKRDSE